MIWFRDGRWSITCGGCLATLDDRTGTREEVRAYLRDVAFWELQEADMCRCVDCARRARGCQAARRAGARGAEPAATMKRPRIAETGASRRDVLAQ